jgi:hypothetical protein
MDEGFDPHVDVSPLLNVDMNTIEWALRSTSYTKFGEKPLRLSDLDAINWSTVASSLLGISDPIGQLEQWLASVLNSFFSNLENFISSALSPISDAINNVFSAISAIGNSLNSLINTINNVVVVPIQSALQWISNNFPQIVNAVNNLISTIYGFIGSFTSMGNNINNLFNNLASTLKSDLSQALNQVAQLADTINTIISKVTSSLANVVNNISTGLGQIANQIAELPGIINGLVNNITNTLVNLTDNIKSGFSWFIGQVTNLPTIVKDLTDKLIGDITSGVGGVVEWVKNGFNELSSTMFNWFTQAKDWFGQATAILKEVGVAFMGFTNAVVELPRGLQYAFEDQIKFFKILGIWMQDFINNPANWVEKYIVIPMISGYKNVGLTIWNGLIAFGDVVWNGISWLWDRVATGVSWFAGKTVDAAKFIAGWATKAASDIGNWFSNLFNAIFTPPKSTQREVEQILESALSRTGGVAENLWFIGGELAKPFWVMTLTPLLVRGLVNSVGDFELQLKPEIFGSSAGGVRWKVKASDVADALVRGLEMYYSGFGMGLSMGIANMLMVNLGQLYTPRVIEYYDPKMKEILGDVLKSEYNDNAQINMFLKPVSETELIDYARRMLALSGGLSNEKSLKALLATVRAYLKIYGLPKWYIDFLTSLPENMAISFNDRFGADRKVFLSHLFELPTYSDLARMTQRDIFPDVKTMQKVGWVRGWNEDLTSMMYLLTFNYPSFEKLWSFYMRSIAGMLWFNPPDIMKNIYTIEANQLKAGVPVAPLDLQKALQGPDQVKALELAINTYFKWMAYSSFSWFTPSTEVYGVNVGNEIVSKLGGWTADSWILADTAADIPGRIDLRWMSRYSLIQFMGDRLNTSGIKFESYTPLINAIPSLIDLNPTTNIQLDLRWFSKLLQATGLHPAWVPVVSVAENIMAVTDEMTLLRSGWLNLFKEGMINVTDAERYLSGLLVTSYQIGYWDPVQKVWTSGWINLPVRWLPHERKLIELRMTIDRVMDIFKETYSYIKSGIRALAITKDDAKQRLTALINKLDAHYKTLTKAITGQEFEIKLDSDYIDLWLNAQEMAQDIEAVERARTWWSRAAGYLMYRMAYGYVTVQDLDNFLNVVANYIPLFPKEVDAYKGIAKAMLGIVHKENIPSPSTLATFAEYLVLDPNLIKQTLTIYNVPQEYWDLWGKYISIKPVKNYYKSFMSTALKALKSNLISKDDWKKVLDNAKNFGFTPVEIDLITNSAEMELAIDNAKEYIPSPSTLATLVEYVPEVKNYVVQALEAKNVRGIWVELWTKYIYLKALYNDVSKWANSMFTLVEYMIIEMNQLDPVFNILSTYGWEDTEINIAKRTILAEQIRNAFNDVLGTPRTLAEMSRYNDTAADWAYSRASKMIDMLPVDNNTKAVLKEMWSDYITSYQANEEIHSYMDELINAYAHGVLDDTGLEAELNYLRKLGVPELRLALVKRQGYLRRARIAASSQ